MKINLPPKMIRPEKALVFDPSEFCRALDEASAIAKQGPKRSPEEMLQAQCLDSTMMNFGIAIGHRYPDRIKFESFMLRWKAMGIFLFSGELTKLHPNQEPGRLMRCLAEAAAVCPLTSNGELERETFLVTLEGKLQN